MKVFVYDPTAVDSLSKVRGIGRYLETIRENFPEFGFISDSRSMPYDSIFINPFLNFLQAPILLKRIAKKQIGVIHDLIPLKYPEHFPFGIKGGINIFLNNQALKEYDLIVTDSQASKNDIIKILKVNEQKIKVVYPCLQSDFYKSETQNPKHENFCIYVGDATWNKNLVNLAKAIKIADVSCVFVGKVFTNPITEPVNPWLKELKEFLSLAKGDKRFIFPGYVSNQELISLYGKAVLNILVSRDEGFGFSYLEAGSRYCPSVLSDIPVMREISGGNAVFADPNNSDDIASKIKELFIHKGERDRFAKSAFERSRKFSVENFKNDFLQIL